MYSCTQSLVSTISRISVNWLVVRVRSSLGVTTSVLEYPIHNAVMDDVNVAYLASNPCLSCDNLIVQESLEED